MLNTIFEGKCIDSTGFSTGKRLPVRCTDTKQPELGYITVIMYCLSLHYIRIVGNKLAETTAISYLLAGFRKKDKKDTGFVSTEIDRRCVCGSLVARPIIKLLVC